MSRRTPCSVPTPGRPPRVDRAAIAAAAVRVGFDRLSMTGVAAELGVAHPTLYRHVRDRVDLLELAVDTLLAGVERPTATGEWRDYLRRTGEVVYAVLVAAPGLADALRDTPAAPPTMVAWFAEVVARLVELGFSDDHALLAADLVIDLAADSAGRVVGTAPEERVRGVQQWAAALPDELAGRVAAVAGASPAAWLARKLEVVLDGVAMSLAPHA